VAAAFSLIGLIAAGLVTYSFIRNPLPLPASAARAQATATPISAFQAGATPTTRPATSNTVTPAGSLVYAKSGILYVQTGANIVQITTPYQSSQASDPAWSPDGNWVYYIDTRRTNGYWYDPSDGDIEPYLLPYPVLCRIHPDGTGEEDLKTSLIRRDGQETFFWMRQPSISPDGSTVAMISDGPTDPGVSDAVLSFLSIGTGAFENTPDLEENSPLGHGNPAYSPDGKTVAYVEEGRNGSQGDPTIWLYNVASRTARPLARGYRDPSWSPDGRFLAVTKGGPSRPDIAVLDASSGAFIGQVTSDGESWSPVWSPVGDTVLYMQLGGSSTSLQMVQVAVSPGQLSYVGVSNLMDYSGIDPGTRVAWYIPKSSGASPSPSGASQ
jgi:Tol biopolymer transport system component